MRSSFFLSKKECRAAESAFSSFDREEVDSAAKALFGLMCPADCLDEWLPPFQGWHVRQWF